MGVDPLHCVGFDVVVVLVLSVLMDFKETTVGNLLDFLCKFCDEKGNKELRNVTVFVFTGGIIGIGWSMYRLENYLTVNGWRDMIMIGEDCGRELRNWFLGMTT